MTTDITTRKYRHVIPIMMRLKREPSCKDMAFKPESPFPNAETVLQKKKVKVKKIQVFKILQVPFLLNLING